MAGIFGFFDFTKEGKGVYPDDPPRGPFATFFGILGRKFWKIVTINLMYVLFSLPALAIAFFSANFIQAAIMPRLTAAIQILSEQQPDLADLLPTMQLFLLILICCLFFGLSLIINGPVHAGVTYLLRNYAREEHAFVWMDFREQVKNNWKQSLASSLISMVLTFIMTYSFWFYGTSQAWGSSGMIPTILRTVIVIFFLIWCIMQMYLYPMMVTFDLKLKPMLKNCLLFSLLRLPLNLLMILAQILILFIIPGILLFIGHPISIFAALIWYLFIAFGLNLLMTNFFAYRAIDKYMLSRLRGEGENEVLTEEEASDAEPAAEEEESESEERPLSEEPEPQSEGLAHSPG